MPPPLAPLANGLAMNSGGCGLAGGADLVGSTVERDDEDEDGLEFDGFDHALKPNPKEGGLSAAVIGGEIVGGAS